MKSRPHILHVVDSLAPGGAERMAIEIANATDPSQFKTSLCVTRSNMALSGALKPTIGIICLGRQRTFEWKKFDEFGAYCQAEAVQILHVHGRSSLILVAFLFAYDRRLRNVEVVFHDHYGDVESRPALPRHLYLALRYLNPYYVGVHDILTQAALRAGLNSCRARTIRNAIDFRPYSERRAIQSQTTGDLSDIPQGIVVANVRPSKDITLLLSALAQICQKPWQMAIVGSLTDRRYSQSCQELARRFKIDRRVRFLGARLDVHDLIIHSDFGALSSASESGPLALLEYAASALPFVSTRVGLIGRYFDDHHIPEFVDPGDVKALSEALGRLINLSPADRRVRGEHARLIAAEYFDIQFVISEWHQVYTDMLRG